MRSDSIAATRDIKLANVERMRQRAKELVARLGLMADSPDATLAVSGRVS